MEALVWEGERMDEGLVWSCKVVVGCLRELVA